MCWIEHWFQYRKYVCFLFGKSNKYKYEGFKALFKSTPTFALGKFSHFACIDSEGQTCVHSSTENLSFHKNKKLASDLSTGTLTFFNGVNGKVYLQFHCLPLIVFPWPESMCFPGRCCCCHLSTWGWLGGEQNGGLPISYLTRWSGGKSNGRFKMFHTGRTS